MNLLPILRIGSAAPVCDTEDIYDVLTAVLPAFIALADCIRRREDVAAVGVPGSSSTDTATFHLHFYAKLFTLNAVLTAWNPIEVVQPSSADEAELQSNLIRILDELESRFLSWKDEKVSSACLRLGLGRGRNEPYPKLHALRRILPEKGESNDDFINALTEIIRIGSKSARKREKLLQNLDQALGFFYNLQSSTTESDSSCPKRFSDYPWQHIRKFTKSLFEVLQKSWCCQCRSSSPWHVSRKARLNLTQHQRFETARCHGQDFSTSQAIFRILFATSSRNLEWQDTEIAVQSLYHELAEHKEVQDDFCGIIQGVEAGIRPRMAVVEKKLWQLRADIEINRSFSPQLQDSEFSCSSPRARCESGRLNQPHRFPDILSLGILLLEIARGASIDFQEPQDRCVAALQCLDKWKRTCRSSHSRTVPDGLSRAISACIDPKELRKDFLDKASVSDLDVRKYIFERILFPLEDALATAYEIQLNTLHTEISQVGKAGENEAFDHYDEHRLEKQEAAKDWYDYLGNVHDLVYDCMDRCERLSEADQKTTRVKIAVLDTGLQLPEELHANYVEEGRINVGKSESFILDTCEADWAVDVDGHGSRVGQIVLQVAPTADLHVARVFKSRRDLESLDIPEIGAQVCERISSAIDRATNEWRVDMIIMSFGFSETIPLIQDAMERASKVEKPPLFFAATRNDGAHKSMAWPARDSSVIGISSTAGDGDASAFNPPEEDAHPILYAFGEGVPVKVAAPGTPKGYITKHVSGTSYATPVAAALAANLLGTVRMLVKAASLEDKGLYHNLPLDLHRMSGMLAVLRHRMQKKHNWKTRTTELRRRVTLKHDMFGSTLEQISYNSIGTEVRGVTKHSVSSFILLLQFSPAVWVVIRESFKGGQVVS
ncbi:hypothetical protein ACJ41O_010459 [Fusarium nematophilum]